jgi:hypothetical protein
MNALPAVNLASSSLSLERVARFPKLRALTWAGNVLYAARGYGLVRTTIAANQIPCDRQPWESAASFQPSHWRRWTVGASLTARLFRDGFHALAMLPSGGMVAAVPGAIITLHPGEREFKVTHAITRGTRPLHITAAPSGTVFWGEYFDNASRDQVHIYGSSDSGATWNVAYTFPRGAIRHVHHIVYDRWGDCLWVLTGDMGDECRILRASCDFSRIEVVLQGNQQTRAVALVPTEDGVYFSSDTPLEDNYIYHLDRRDKLSTLAPLSSSSTYGGRVGSSIFFSTMVEPSSHNADRHARIYGGGRQAWSSLLAWKKDRWPMSLFQYGNAILPDGENATPYLAVSTVAVEADDLVTSLYAVRS